MQSFWDPRVVNFNNVSIILLETLVWSFLLTVDNFSFLLTVGVFCIQLELFSAYSWSVFAHNGKVRLISAFRDCKRRSLTVSKKLQVFSKITK